MEAVASGGAFEFKLIVDKNYFQTLDSIKVTANGTVITPDVYDIYTLSNQTTDVAVNVTGISGVTHLITLVQSANGVIAFTGDEDAENSRTVNHGDYNPQIERYAVLKRSVQFFAEVSKRSVQFSSKHKRHSNNL